MRLSREHVSLMGAIQIFLTASNPERAPTTTSIQQLTATSSVCNSDVHKALHPSSSAKSAAAVVVDVS